MAMKTAVPPFPRANTSLDSPLSMSKEITLIIKVTNACNMRCRDCFIEPSVFHKTMVSDTAKRLIRVFLDSDWFDTVHSSGMAASRCCVARAFSKPCERAAPVADPRLVHELHTDQCHTAR